MATEKEKTESLRIKLGAIRRKFKTFAAEEEAAKKNKGGKSYKYTPGYAIVEAIRQEMDALGIQLEPNMIKEEHMMIDRRIYPEINGMIQEFHVDEMYSTVTIEYRWIDENTGEVIGPFTQIAGAANGTDKSVATAISLAERYFLLKYFQITTHETELEIDARNTDFVPGLQENKQANPAVIQPNTTKATQQVQQRPQPTATPVQQFTPQQPVQKAQQSQNVQGEMSNQTYKEAVEQLMYFEAGTDSHSKMLNHWLTQLRLAGFNTSEPSFTANLVNLAQARRTGQAA